MRKIILIVLCLFSFNNVFAQAPSLVEVNFQNCTPAPEICGNGVDEDCNGHDALCPGNDKDNDGFLDSQDCEPENHFVYPGISTSCVLSGCPSGGTRTCQTSGSYSACSCTPLCEAKGSGRCYYVDPVDGNDANTGTFTSKLKTLRRFGFYSNPASGPSNPVALQAGDVVYMFSGLYNSQALTLDKQRFLVLRSRHGTPTAPIVLKNYPGEKPVVKVPSPTEGLYVLSSSNINIEGIIFDGADNAGIMLADVDKVNIRNTVVRNTRGFDNLNLSGIYLVAATNVDIGHSVIYDNYDRECADTGGKKGENSRNMVIFNGGNVRVHHSAIFQTPPTTADLSGACIVQKHSQSLEGSNLVIDYNSFRNCAFNAIGTGGFNGHFHHNVIMDSDVGFRIKDHGGFPNYYNNLMEYNTLINTPALEYNPADAASVGKAFHNQIFRNNIIKDNKSYLYAAVATFMIDPFAPDTVHDEVYNNQYLKSSNNCYYSSRDSSMFSFFAVNSTPDKQRGSVNNLSSWKSLGFDAGSFETNPQLDSNYIPQNSNCANKGHSIR